MVFELWDVEANKYLGRFEHEQDALILVRTLVDHYGEAYADRLDLGATNDEDAESEPLFGGALLKRVREVLGSAQELGERQAFVIASRA